jgi:hypothetical protein
MHIKEPLLTHTFLVYVNACYFAAYFNHAVVESKLRYKYNLILLLCDFLIEAQTG